MKKVFFTVLAAAALSSALFAADKSKKSEIAFSNELSSDIVHHIGPRDDSHDSHTAFAGIKENVVADYQGKIIKVGADATLTMSDANNTWNDDDDLPFLISDWDADWYVEFNPFKVVGFGFSDELYTPGSYLPVWDGNINAGNYSTNGFSVLIRPIDELTFGAGFDVPAKWFGSGDYKDANAYEIALGVDYEMKDTFAIGGSLRHIGTDDAFQVGAYVSLMMIDNLTLNIGFTHSDDGDAGLDNVTFLEPYGYWTEDDGWVSYIDATGIYGENILSAGAQIDLKNFTLLADAAFNFDGDYRNAKGYKANLWNGAGYDFYTAVDFIFGLTDKLTLDIKGLFLADFGDNTVWSAKNADWRKLDPTVGVYPKIVFDLNDHHKFSAGIKLQTCFDSDYGYTEFALPVSWKYTY